MMNKKELPVISVVLYALGILIAAFTIVYAYYVLSDITDSVVAGQLSLSGNVLPIIIHCMTEFGVFIVYTLLVIGLGAAISYAATAAANNKTDMDFEPENEDDKAIDLLFKVDPNGDTDKKEWKK